jgi:hypothetical protein
LRHVSQVRPKLLKDEDVDFLNETEGILIKIQPPYKEMDRVWAGEEKWLSRLTDALKDHRLDPKDIGHWGGFQESLNQIHADWEVWLSSQAVVCQDSLVYRQVSAARSHRNMASALMRLLL